MILLAAFNCPSDWGWKVDDIYSLTPAKEKSSRQKLPVKTGPHRSQPSSGYHEA
jgi:hypothetical protein